MTESDALYNWLRANVQRQRRAQEEGLKREWAEARTAIHEAGHAVVALALGAELGLVTMNSLLCSALDVHRGASKGASVAGFTLMLAKGRRRTAALVAGKLAEEAFGLGADWSDVGLTQDRDALDEYAALKGRNPEQVRLAAEALARPLVWTHKAGIEAVAAELRAGGMLSAARVRELIAHGARRAA